MALIYGQGLVGGDYGAVEETKLLRKSDYCNAAKPSRPLLYHAGVDRRGGGGENIIFYQKKHGLHCRVPFLALHSHSI